MSKIYCGFDVGDKDTMHVLHDSVTIVLFVDDFKLLANVGNVEVLVLDLIKGG